MAIKVLDSDSFGEKIYERFPSRYKEDDVEQNYSLKRFIFTASDGGFKHIIEDANGILNLIDPNTAPIEVVKAMYEQFGVSVFNGIPEEFLRGFLPNLGEALDYRGTLTVIDYIASSVTGVKVDTVVEVNDDDNSVDLKIILDISGSKLKYFPDYTQFIGIMENFIPFYCALYVIYNYNYTDKQFNIFIAHCLKFVEKIYPNPPLVFEYPEDNFLYYVDESSDLLIDVNGDVFISDYECTWNDIENSTWRDLLSVTWLRPIV